MNSIDAQVHINSNTPKTKFVLLHKKRNLSFLNSKRKKNMEDYNSSEEKSKNQNNKIEQKTSINEEYSDSEGSSIKNDYSDELLKSLDNNTYNTDLYRFMTNSNNMDFLKPKLMENEHYESFCIKCSETQGRKKNEVHIIKNTFKELFLKFKSYKKNYLIDFNNNLIEKWSIMFKIGIGIKLENLKKYKRRYDLRDIEKEYLFVIKKIFFEIPEKNIFNYFWYMYILPKDLLIIIMERLKENDEFWLDFISDLKNYWVAILRCGGVEPFLKKMNLF